MSIFIFLYNNISPKESNIGRIFLIDETSPNSTCRHKRGINYETVEAPCEKNYAVLKSGY